MHHSSIVIETNHATAILSLIGGQIIHWAPSGHKPVLWLSDKAAFNEGKAIRGGVPVCWPWFGTKNNLPAHGLVRTRLWKHSDTIERGDVTCVKLQCFSDANTLSIWPFPFFLEIEYHIGKDLRVVLSTYNTGQNNLYITEALHTYFLVSHIKNVVVNGFEGVEYLDKTNDFIAVKQQGNIKITEETDRIYLSPGPATILDKGWKRKIHIKNSGNEHTVIWNPGPEKSQAMTDILPRGYTKMLCLEAANTNDIVVLPGEKHTLTQEIGVITV
ncbi:MAG TPA: D-hexose-6-phosphate mutarotase [Saprospiraceae bacterium]|nr:D-hexose-6-phosphate mutarotase [Saprospiraceae bacterium]